VADLCDEAPASTWLVDGFNLLHAVVLRGADRKEWWRAGARDRVLALARGFDDLRVRLVVVFDGPRPPDEPEPLAPEWPEVVFAASADDWMVRAVRLAPEPSRVAVVTADRKLADRARHRGARVVGPWAFARRCVGPASA
jgi:hypothetical protein